MNAEPGERAVSEHVEGLSKREPDEQLKGSSAILVENCINFRTASVAEVHKELFSPKSVTLFYENVM